MRKASKADITSLKGFKIKLYPTDNQKKEIDRNIQVSRSVYNLRNLAITSSPNRMATTA